MGHPNIRMQELLEARKHVRKDLLWLRNKLDRLLEHLDHMDAGDLDRIYPLIDAMLKVEIAGVSKARHELRAIHGDDQCERDRQREGLFDPPASDPASSPSVEPSRWGGIKEAWRQRGW